LGARIPGRNTPVSRSVAKRASLHQYSNDSIRNHGDGRPTSRRCGISTVMVSL
jgi:hypothetical protein